MAKGGRLMAKRNLYVSDEFVLPASAVTQTERMTAAPELLS